MPRQRRLLILDDDLAIAQTIAIAAEDHGFDVSIATSPAEMCRNVKRWEPSHLAIDLIMPDMDGVEVLRTLAGIGCDASIILMSGMGVKVLEAAQRSATERGLHIAGLLPKPFNLAALRTLLDVSGKESEPLLVAQSPTIRSAFSTEELLNGIHSGQFFLHYQPKIRIADAEVIGVEALARWHHPTDGLIYPMHFIPRAEEAGILHVLTYKLFDEGLEWLNRTATLSTISLAMNISSTSFTEQDLVDRLYWSCLKFQIDPRRIILELTETSAMNESAVAYDILTRLRIKGFSLSIDDFGTGYSSLTQLARLPFSEIKVDRTFVISMLKSAEAMTIVESTIQLGKRLGLTTVAEGVEGADEMQMLRNLHCDEAQGYYIARPADGEAARALIQNWESQRFV